MPTITTSVASLPDFGAVTVGSSSSEQSYTVSGTNLTADIIVNAPTDFEVSKVGSGVGFGPSVTLLQTGGLVSGQTVYVRFSPLSTGAKAGNITHDSTGATQKLVAVSGTGTGALASEPTVQASGVNFTAVTSNSMTVNWTNGNGASRIVLAKAGGAVDSPPVDGNSYTASASFGSGTQIGTGNFVVFIGSGSSVNVTNLNPSTTYHFAVYEFNGSGGTENFLTTSPATGSQATTFATYTWNAVGSAPWTTATNWTPTRTSPASTDVLQFNAGGSVTATSVPTQTIGQLLISGNTAVTLQAGGTNTLTISGGTGTDLDLGAGSALNVDTATVLTIAVGASATGSISGSMTFSGASHKLTSGAASAITFNSGASFTQGTGHGGDVFGATGTAGGVVFANGSTFIQNAGSNPFAVAGAGALVVFNPTSNFLFQSATGSPALSGRTYGNLEINSASPNMTSMTGTGALTVTDLKVTSGTANFNLTVGGINIKGNLTSSSGASLGFSPSAANILSFNGTSNQTVNGTGTLTFGANTNFTLDNATGMTLNRDITLGGPLTLTTGALSVGSNILTLNGNTSVSGGTLSAATGTVNYNQVAAGQNVIAAEYFVLNFSGGSKILPSGTIGIKDIFSPGGTSGHTITGNTIDFQKAGSQTIPAFNYNNLANTGNSFRTYSGTVGIAGTFSPGNGGPHTVTGSTIEYNGTAAQNTITADQGFIYNNLSINNSAGVTLPALSGSANVNSTLFLKSGLFTLTDGSDLVLLGGATIDRSAGSISTAPAFGASVNVIYSGTTGVTTGPEIPTNASVLNNLNINNSGGVTLGADAQCNGVLTLTTDLTVPDPRILTQAGTSAGAGDVVGSVQRNDVGTTTRSFGNPNVQITEAVGTITSMIVRLAKGVTPGGFSSAVQRTYSLEPLNGINTVTATVRLHYLDSELNSNDESLLTLWRASDAPAATWENKGFTGRDTTTGNWVEGAATAFSAWALAQAVPNAPTAVKLTKFNAASFADGVQLSWESGYEVNNLGYHVYREQNGRRTRVTPAVVAGSALTVGPGSRLTAGYSYSWFDGRGTADTAYYLEAIDLDGTRQGAGPLYPDARASKSASPRQQRAMLLSELAATSISPGAGAGAASSTNLSLSDIKSDIQSDIKVPTSLSKNANLSSLTRQQEIAAGRALKIQVRGSGWYRITQPELVAAGFDPTTDARLLQLYVDGEEVPIALSHNGARLNAGDTLEFYGVGLDLPTTDTRVYWLVNGSSAGKRINGKGDKWKTHPGGKESTVRSFDYTTERREKLIYFANLRNGDAENIFGAPVLSEPVSQTLTVRNLDTDLATAGSPAYLEVALQGLTVGTHQVQLQINGTPLGAITFADRERKVQKFAINRALLREGDNAVSLVATAGDSDISLIDWLRLTYAHQYRADDNLLRFNVPGGQTVRVGGFTTPNVRVLDITNPQAPVELGSPVNAAGESGGSYAVTVAAGTSSRTLLAFAADLAADQAGHPLVTANQPSSWNAATNGADMVIITHQNFRQAIEPLAALRRSQGLSVSVVDVEDVYDEYSFGMHTPLALKRFLASTAGAAGNWSRKPQYLLLVGDSSWDPRNYLDQGANDFVPTKLIDTNHMETGSDDWLADYNDVGLVTMAIGRLPGRTAAEVNLMVSKILTYEQERETNAPLRDAVMVSDSGFERQSAQTGALMPAGVEVQTINRSEVGNDDLMRGQIVEALNAGPMLVNYYGHGSVSVWTGASLLDGDSAAGLTNTNRLSLYVMMTCLNGYAHDAYIDSLGESALKAPNGGAVAVWASSGFTDSSPQFAMNTEFYRLLFGASGPSGSPQTLRLGQATRSAKAAISDPDVRRTWTLLGDPAMRIR